MPKEKTKELFLAHAFGEKKCKSSKIYCNFVFDEILEMEDRIDIRSISKIVKKAIDKNAFSKFDTSLIIYDCNFLKKRISKLQNLFPKTTNHAIAVKSNPLIKILEYFKELGTGLETASLPELFIAEKVGIQVSKIVFDSPSKTREEIIHALKLGVHLNIDSFSELKRVSNLLKDIDSNSNIGLRINPQVGSGTIKTTSVADKISKFGIPIDEHYDEIIKAYVDNEWLNGIHIHIGSQGISIDQLIQGLEKVFNLSEIINQSLSELNRKIEFFDIGGGFPVSYGNNKVPQIEEYVSKINQKFPKLFKDYKIVTEFGRFVNANSAFAISRVEYVKNESDYKILSIHLGADFMLRKAYNPNDWHHEISVLNSNGNIKKGTDNKKYIIAGPLCFASDIIAKDISLPVVEEGDLLIIHDVGAYTLSMWSRYNSRRIPKILGYKNNKFSVLKNKEKSIDLYNFWL